MKDKIIYFTCLSLEENVEMKYEMQNIIIAKYIKWKMPRWEFRITHFFGLYIINVVYYTSSM